MTIEWMSDDSRTVWITNERVQAQQEEGPIWHYTDQDRRKILVELAKQEHIVPDMTDGAISSWLEACGYGGALSLDAFAHEYSGDHNKRYTWLDCEVRGFQAIKITTGYWIYRADVPDED